MCVRVCVSARVCLRACVCMSACGCVCARVRVGVGGVGVCENRFAGMRRRDAYSPKLSGYREELLGVFACEKSSRDFEALHDSVNRAYRESAFRRARLCRGPFATHILSDESANRACE